MMGAAGDGPEGLRLRGVIVMLWRTGLRISEALALNETDLDPDRGAVLVRHGKATSVARLGWTVGESAGIDESAGRNRHGAVVNTNAGGRT